MLPQCVINCDHEPFELAHDTIRPYFWIEQFVYKRCKVFLVEKADPPDFGFVNMGKKFANVWADLPGVWKGLVPTVEACQVFTELDKLWCVGE